MENRLREALNSGRFAITVEVVPASRDLAFEESLVSALSMARALVDEPRLAGLSVTDRVRSDEDHDPVRVAAALAWASGIVPVVHLSGKDREPGQLARSLGALAEAGIDNVLCVTGDRLKAMPAARAVRYVDSVDAVRLSRRLLPSAFIAAGVSPFKYTEEESLNQYFKMAKKHAAGADYVVTQVGWDMRKLAELIRYRRERGLVQPVMANLMLLPVGAARRMHKGGIPGAVVTDDLLALVEYEAQAPDKGRAARLDRLALQIVGAERLGYAGVQLSGLAIPEDVRRAVDSAGEWSSRLPTVDDWRLAWDEIMRLPTGGTARLDPSPGYFLFDTGPRSGAAEAPSAPVRRRYTMLGAVHGAVFHRASPIFHLLAPLARRVPAGSRLAGWLERLERLIKEPLVGCQMCGHCRLPETFYVCPETCPKGLANGPCGGSSANICEAGERECVHSVLYRLAKTSGRLDDLERALVAPVPERRGGSSWLNYFAGRSLTHRASPPEEIGR
jgi:methylenetetrahydrofolate reductase (NADPH)